MLVLEHHVSVARAFPIDGRHRVRLLVAVGNMGIGVRSGMED
jgi:hypothetical protein